MQRRLEHKQRRNFSVLDCALTDAGQLLQRSDPISKTALDCTLHLKGVVDDDEPINKLFREIANPYGDLKQNRFLQKTVTVDVKNLNSKSEAYQQASLDPQSRYRSSFQGLRGSDREAAKACWSTGRPGLATPSVAPEGFGWRGSRNGEAYEDGE